MKDDKVLSLVPKGEVPSAKVLADAQAAEIEDVVVLGWDKNGLMYFKSANQNGPEILWMLEQARFALLESGRT